MKEKKSYNQELLEWRYHQLRFQKKYKDTPAGFADSESEKRAFRQWKEDVRTFRRSRDYQILSSYFPAPELFVGRKEELEHIRNAVDSRKGPVILYGIGGIGKSALARAYVRRYGTTYDHVLYLSFQTSMQCLITDDVSIRISHLEYHTEIYGSQRKYFQVKYNILKNIAASEKLLIVIDDCNSKWDKNMEAVFSLPCDLLVTTRRNPCIWKNCVGILVQELRTEEEWEEFIECYRTKELLREEEESIRNYRSKIQGHTLMMIQKIHDPRKEYDGLKDFEQGLLRKFPLKKEEKETMMYLATIPGQGIKKSLFQLISQVSDETLGRLMNYMLVQAFRTGDQEDMVLFLHPIVAAAVRHMEKITPLTCSKYIKGWEEYLNGTLIGGRNTWSRTYLDNKSLEPYIFAFMEAFPRPVPWLASAFDEVVTFLWIQGYFMEAEKYSLTLFETVQEYYGDLHQITGQMALRTAAVYHNASNYKEARKWQLKGAEILERCSAYNEKHPFYLSLAYSKVSRICRHEGNYGQAMEAVKKCFLCLEKYMENCPGHSLTTDINPYIFYAAYLMEESKILFYMGRLNDADRLYQKALEKLLQSPAQKITFIEYQTFRVKILIAKKEFEEAEGLAVKTIYDMVQVTGNYNKIVLHCRERLAYIYEQRGKKEQAIYEYNQIIEQLQIGIHSQDGWINRIIEKLKMLL